MKAAESKQPIKMFDNHLTLLVVDYAKEPSEDGYNIIVYEIQDFLESNLGKDLEPDSPSSKHSEQMATVFNKLFGKNMSYIDSLATARAGSAFANLHKAYRSLPTTTAPELHAAIEVIYYHCVDFNISENPLTRAKYELNPVARFVGRNKIWQRLWLNQNSSLQKFLPKKTMIAMGKDIKEDVDSLAANIIHFHGKGQKVFLKSPQDCLGKGNRLLQIQDQSSLIAELKIFHKDILDGCSGVEFLIETASTIGHSTKKHRMNTYRAAQLLM